MRRLTLTTLAVAGLMLATAPGGGAAGEGRLVVQKGMGGVRLGMTQAEVKAKAGRPLRIERGTNELGSYVVYRYPAYSVTFFNGPRVTQMTTFSPAVRTIRGIGVGSTRAKVATVPGSRCVTESGFSHCYVGTWKPGGTVTDFVLVGGRVARVSVGYVLD